MRKVKIALTTWSERVAPVFDVAGNALLAEVVENQGALDKMKVSVPAGSVMDKVSFFADAGVGLIICGAISREARSLANAYGIDVIAFVAGDADEILEAWVNGRLTDEAYAMPGCRGAGAGCAERRGRRRRRRCRYAGGFGIL